MNRKGFIQITATALLPIFLGLFPTGTKRRKKYSVSVLSNRKFSHALRETSNKTATLFSETEIIIVGGGIAGLSAAVSLEGKAFRLYEGSDRLGGSSASGSYKDTHFALGAHYDLAYPKNYGSEVLDLLTKLEIIHYNSANEMHEFVDKKYLIKEKEAEIAWSQNGTSADILGTSNVLNEFYALLQPYYNQMPLPTRLIDPKFHHLNTITFQHFLESKMQISDDLKKRISYQMLDDWGGRIDEISALAGIHYYTCRPYETKNVELFSPPNGNAYFAEKMIGQIKDYEAFQVNRLVRNVRETNSGVEAEILHPNGIVELVKAKALIYAGQKHALPYLLDTAPSEFAQTDYAPWLVINFIVEKGLPFDKWQNDVLTDELQFLGFVNSTAQHTRSEKYDTLTAYFCFSEQDRKYLSEIEENAEPFIEATITQIEMLTETTISDAIVHVNLHVMGHAMPIPKPHYLRLNQVVPHSERIAYAGVDTGRLPLFFEACDSGILAAKWVLGVNS